MDFLWCTVAPKDYIAADVIMAVLRLSAETVDQIHNSLILLAIYTPTYVTKGPALKITKLPSEVRAATYHFIYTFIETFWSIKSPTKDLIGWQVKLSTSHQEIFYEWLPVKCERKSQEL